MRPSLAIILVALAYLAASNAEAQTDEHWLRCTLTQDIVRDTSGNVTTKDLGASSVIFIIRDATSTLYTYSEKTQTMTKLQADVRARDVNFFDGPLSDRINRVTGTFSVVASPYHEAHGDCVPIDSLATDKPKF
jgi:hypothetical protein